MRHPLLKSEMRPELRSRLRDDFRLVTEARHRRARRLIEVWRSFGGVSLTIGRDLPSRPFAALLENLAVYEPIPGGGDMRVRLAGSATRRRFSGDITGKYMSELFPPEDFAAHLLGAKRSMQTGEPVIIDSRLMDGAVEHLHTEIVILPVTAPDRKGTWKLVGLFFFDQP
jgi:hypothetical protein